MIIRLSKKRAIEIIKKSKQKRIHCFLGSIGCDWSKKEILENIKNAIEVAWASNMFNHHLTTRTDGKIYHFDIAHPKLKRANH